MSLSTEQIRRGNRGLVLRALRELGPTNRGELAQDTGLARATIGAIIALLMTDGMVVSVETGGNARRSRGRPRQLVALREDAMLGLGLELNVDYVSAVVLDLAGDVIWTESRHAGPPPGPTPENALVDLARDLHDHYFGVAGRFVGATVAIPALVRRDGRTVAWAPNVEVRGSRLANRLQHVLEECPVRISNDADCAALAEAHRGAAVGVGHAVYLTGTVGIGAGLIVDGEILHGGAGFAGEVGHMPVGNPDARCGCGRRGCWEASIGLHNVLAAAGMTECDTPSESAQALRKKAMSDPRARRVLEQVGTDLGLGVATLASILDPVAVVLGGYFATLGDVVIDQARRVVDQRLASSVQVRPELRPSMLGLRAASLGAAEQSFADVFAGVEPPMTFRSVAPDASVIIATRR